MLDNVVSICYYILGWEINQKEKTMKHLFNFYGTVRTATMVIMATFIIGYLAFAGATMAYEAINTHQQAFESEQALNAQNAALEGFTDTDVELAETRQRLATYERVTNNLVKCMQNKYGITWISGNLWEDSDGNQFEISDYGNCEKRIPTKK